MLLLLLTFLKTSTCRLYYALTTFGVLTCLYLDFTDPEDLQRVTEKKRTLGLVVIRGTQVSLVSPEEGMEEIANPFAAPAQEEES